MLAGAVALGIAELGVPRIFGLADLSLVLPSALLGGLAGFTRWWPAFGWAGMALLVAGCVIAYTPATDVLVRTQLRADSVPRTADAIVVLSAGLSSDGMLRPQGIDRLLKGIELARQGVSDRIVVTRERKKVNGVWVSSDIDQRRLLQFVPDVESIPTGFASSTREEAVYVTGIARQRNWSRLIVVTSALHARRACRTFERLGLTVTCVPADSRDVAAPLPQEPGDRLRAFALAVYEIAGSIRYRASGWI